MRVAERLSGKSQNFIELLPSAQSSSQNKNSVSTNKNQKLNFSRSALFHMKTRVCLKYFVNDRSYLEPRMSFVFNCLSLLCNLNIICVTHVLIVCTRMSFVMYNSYVILIPFVCTFMAFLHHSYVLACHSYVTRVSFVCFFVCFFYLGFFFTNIYESQDTQTLAGRLLQRADLSIQLAAGLEPGTFGF